MINDGLIDYVAELARLRIEEDEKEQIKKDFENIINYFDKLNELDTQDVEPLTHINNVKNIFREDRAVGQKAGNGFIKVPRTVG